MVDGRDSVVGVLVNPGSSVVWGSSVVLGSSEVWGSVVWVSSVVWGSVVWGSSVVLGFCVVPVLQINMHDYVNCKLELNLRKSLFTSFTKVR